MRNLRRKFKGTFIPVRFLFLNLSMTEKYVLAEIDSLDGEDGCWAMNEHFSKILNITPDRAGKIISKLVKKGLIERRIFPSGKGKKRYLGVVSHTVKTPDGHTVKTPEPYGENAGCYRRDTIEITKREGEPPPSSSETPEKKAERMFYSAKGVLTQSDPYESYFKREFFEWFESQVLTRWDKYCVNTTLLTDWLELIYTRFDEDVLLDGLRELQRRTKGWQPKISEAEKICRILVANKRRAEKKKQTQPTVFSPVCVRNGWIERIKKAKPEAIIRYHKGTKSIFIKSMIMKNRPEVFRKQKNG